MIKKLLKKIRAKDARVVVFDIDGTLKDLVKEHQAALSKVMNRFVKGKLIRKKLILFLDRIAMWFVKAGILPTNEKMQRTLITIYATILCENINNFNELYEVFYEAENILFDEVKAMLNGISKTKDVYFVTINKQNYNLEEQGIASDRIIYTMSEKKVKAYKRLVEEKKLDKNDIIIVGDNIFDDIRAAKKLSIKYLLVDNYDSKFKRMVAKILNVGM